MRRKDMWRVMRTLVEIGCLKMMLGAPCSECGKYGIFVKMKPLKSSASRVMVRRK